MENALEFIGADLSKRSIDLVIHSTKNHLLIDNSLSGFKQMVSWIKESKLKPSKIILVMEHTGLYSYCFEEYLHKRKIRFSKVNPMDIKFTIGITRGKSDKIDAQRIAQYGAEKQDKLRLHNATSKALDNLKMLNTSRGKLVRTRAGLKTSVEEFRNIGLRDSSLALRAQLKVINLLDKEIKALDKQIQITIRQEKQVSKNYNLLTSIQGVGAVVATNTIIKTNNFTRFKNSRKFACFCGIAPFEHSSGSSVRGKTRVNHMADKQMKTLLDLAAKTAIRCDPEIKLYYEKRVAMGKSKMSTINVIRNKIAGRMFAVINRQTPYVIRPLKAA